MKKENITTEYDPALLEAARTVRANAYAPYSRFRVGAALRTASGKIYQGVNVENVSFGGTICAERAAALAAITAGEHGWTEIAVVADTPQPTTPCGICRQFLAEFAPGIKVVVANNQQVLLNTTLSQLLPYAFNTETLASGQEEISEPN